MSEPGATPTRCLWYVASGDDRTAKTVCATCGRPHSEHGATPQPERLSAEREQQIRDEATYRLSPDYVGSDGTAIVAAHDAMAMLAEVDVLRSTIAQLEADGEAATDKWVEYRDEVVRLEAQVAADAPTLQAARAVVEAWSAVAPDSVTFHAALYEACDALVAALLPDPEHTQPSRRTVDMAGRPVGELATRTLHGEDEKEAATERPEWVEIMRRRTPYTYPPVGAVVKVRRWKLDPAGGPARPQVASSEGGVATYTLNADEWWPAATPDSEETP